MKHRHYHTPLKQASSRVACPVCHEATYSTAGIHPQCAIRLSDPPRPKTAPAPASLDDSSSSSIDPASTSD